MPLSHVEILVEEQSMEETLRRIVPKIASNLSFEVYRFQGKHDLLSELPGRLRGYAAYLPRDWRILVVVDRDKDACLDLKHRLEDFAHRAGLTTRSSVPQSNVQVVNRIAIEELEAWFFGDWEAVREAFPRVSQTVPSRQRFRTPDAISGGTWEALERVLRSAGYFKTGLRKIEAARAIAGHMEPVRNLSRSFQVFKAALEEMATSP